MQRETLRKGRLVNRAPRRARNTPLLPVSALRPAELRQNPQLCAPFPSPAPQTSPPSWSQATKTDYLP